MPSKPPDPSAPNAQEAAIRQVVMDTLSDPLGYPDAMISWMQEFIALQMPKLAPVITENTTSSAP